MMTMIKRIEATGLKNEDFAHDLGRVTVFHGPNGAGKTARLDAIMLALLGYVPEIGKTKGATLGMARNGSITVKAVMDDGTVIGRSYSRKAKADTDAPIVPAVLLDPAVFFDLGEKDRVRYIFSQTGCLDKLPEEIIAKVKSIRLPDHSPAADRTITESAEHIDQTDRDRHDEGTPVNEWVTEMIEQCRADVRAAKQVVSLFESQIGAATELSGPPATDVTGRLNDASAQVASLSDELARLSEQKREMVASLRTIERTRNALQKECTPLDELKRRRDILMADVVKEVELREKATRLGNTVSRLREAVRGIEARLKMASNDLQIHNREIEGAAAWAECPVCHATGDDLHNRLAAHHHKVTAELESRILKIKAERAAASTELETAQSETAAIEKELLMIGNPQYGVHSIEVQMCETETCERQRKVLAEMEAQQPSAADVLMVDTKMTAIGGEITRLKGDIAWLTKERDRWIVQQRDEERRAESVANMHTAIAVHEVKKAVLAVFEESQRFAVNGAIDGLMRDANRVVGWFFDSPIEIRDGEIGMQQGTTWISYRTFSGTEKALVFVGVAIALSMQHPIRIAVIDELGRLDEDAMAVLMRKVQALINDGIIHQFIGATAARYVGPGAISVG